MRRSSRDSACLADSPLRLGISSTQCITQREDISHEGARARERKLLHRADELEFFSRNFLRPSRTLLRCAALSSDFVQPAFLSSRPDQMNLLSLVLSAAAETAGCQCVTAARASDSLARARSVRDEQN